MLLLTCRAHILQIRVSVI
uniref:Uncharacterized protein n=1 Tax=Arundo donax TaxID=35708 RepID=A0A0A9EHJ9_ARUDO